MMDQFRESFKEEAYEMLDQMEDSLMEIEKNPENDEQISNVFRAMHTIKGSSGMFGFDRISSFSHQVENTLDLLRSRQISVTDELVRLILDAKDYIHELLDCDEVLSDKQEKLGTEILAGFNTVENFKDSEHIVGTSQPPAVEGPAAGEGQPAAVPREDPAEGDMTESVTYRIHFKPNDDIYLTGGKPYLILKELSGLGDYTCIPEPDNVPALSKLNAEKCFLAYEILLTTKESINIIRDVFIFVEKHSELAITKIESQSDAMGSFTSKRLGEILVEKGLLSGNDLENALHEQKRVGEVLVESKKVSKSAVQGALREQQHLKMAMDKKAFAMSTATIRVASGKLDNLVDLVGELVTYQARLSQTAGETKHAELVQIAEHVERLTSELRDNAMSMRMLPVGMTFNRYRRLVHDLSADMNKKNEMITSGGETELDKTVIERLNEPLVHLIRNSIDHGIESPQARKTAGKPETGTILLSARHSGAFVLLEISDDGAGLDNSAIKEKAVSRGLMTPDQELPDKELYQFLFHPGFSTAAEVTSISGRGVGMDVVKKQIEGLGGSVFIESTYGQGTKITMKLPLTLAIIDGFLVRCGQEFYVFPMANVVECMELTPEKRKEHPDRGFMNVRNAAMPIIGLRDVFGIEGQKPDIEQIVILQIDEMKTGVLVDSIIGDFQTVIKPLGKLYKKIRGVSGATILGDGTIALIVDMNGIFNILKNEVMKP